jgi:inward rectifier potassium channel
MEMSKQVESRRRAFDPFTRTAIRKVSSDRSDFYHRALRLPWSAFMALLGLGVLALNALFGLLYMLRDGAIAGTQPGSFLDLFFFSVQTFTTIGYGAMYPQTMYGHVLVTIEAITGLLSIGLIAMLAFARVSLPIARIRFSNVAVIADFDGTPTLMFRAANERRNSLISARAQVSLLRQETTREGAALRRFYDLELARSETPVFSLSWLILHPITTASPLYQLTEADMQKGEFALLVTITGLDETVSQTMHARHAYLSTDVRWNHRFRDMIEELASGDRVVDLRRIDQTEPVDRDHAAHEEA